MELLPRSKRIIAALDLATPSAALEFMKTIGPFVGPGKVGPNLFLNSVLEGRNIIRELLFMNTEVFLDLKLKDKPNQIHGAVAAITKLGVSMFTVDTAGGKEMMRAARDSVDATHQEFGNGRKKPLIIGVTVLTSLIETDEGPVEKVVRRKALLAQSARLDGCTTSPREVKIVREACGPDFTIVTPGISLSGGLYADQKRTGTAVQAVTDGADYVVVGTAFLQSREPVKVAIALAAELAALERGV